VDRVQRRGATLLFAFAGFAYLLDRVTKLWAERTLQDAPADVMRSALATELGLPEEGIAVVGD